MQTFCLFLLAHILLTDNMLLYFDSTREMISTKKFFFGFIITIGRAPPAILSLIRGFCFLPLFDYLVLDYLETTGTTYLNFPLLA